MRNLHLIDAHVQEKMEKRRSARLIFSFNAFFCENRFFKKPKSLITRSTCLGDFRNVVLQQWAKLWTRKQKADVVTAICFLLNIFFCQSLLNKILPEGLNHAHSWENNFLPWIFALEKWQYENNFEHLSCLVLQVKMNTTLTFK